MWYLLNARLFTGICKLCRSDHHAAVSVANSGEDSFKVQYDEPATAQSEEPATAQSEEPATAQSEEPATAQSEEPATAQSEEPATAQSEEPATAQSEEPATAQSEVPAVTQSEELARAPEPIPEFLPAQPHASSDSGSQLGVCFVLLFCP